MHYVRLLACQDAPHSPREAQIMIPGAGTIDDLEPRGTRRIIDAGPGHAHQHAVDLATGEALHQVQNLLPAAVKVATCLDVNDLHALTMPGKCFGWLANRNRLAWSARGIPQKPEQQ